MDKLSSLLLIDEDPDYRALIRQTFTREFSDLGVSEIRNAQEFTAALEAGEFDLVITDYSLSWMNGFEVLETIKKRHPYRLAIAGRNC